MSAEIHLEMFQIDAFANKAFEGNPAAVCALESWLPTDVMQAIAAENNLAETAFFIQQDNGFAIRWFTPAAEVDLCGHATLASAFVLFNEMAYQHEVAVFHSRSGPLEVRKNGDEYIMDFPSQVCTPCHPPEELLSGLGPTVDAKSIKHCAFNEDYLVELESQNAVEQLRPDMRELAKLATRGVIVTAQSTEYDFVCRFFAPGIGVDEDPVTGSAFTKLTPYWAKKRSKQAFSARQLSKRGGNVSTQLVAKELGDRVILKGRAVKYLQGTIMVPESL